MKNKTIKTYQEITVEEAGEMLRENRWKPVEGLAHKEAAHPLMIDSDRLIGIDVESECPFEFKVGHHYARAFKVTEIDPCKAPDGCPELEPWMAYVGMDVIKDNTNPDSNRDCIYASDRKIDEWLQGCSYRCATCYKSIDVRTEWAQEHFPDHCRIRNYQAPDAFEEWFHRMRIDPNGYKETYRQAYELGQANTTKGTK